MENDWKNLEIGNIPSDFFANERYETEYFNSVEEEWFKTTHTPIRRIELIVNELNLKYRYRLKPLESIRVSQKVYDYLLDKLREDYANGGEFEYSVSRFDDDSPWVIDHIEDSRVEIIN